MKIVRLFFLLLFIPVTFHAQKTLTGVWAGTLSNDSTTVRRDQSFEITLVQYKQKVTGYTRSTFIVNDTLYYILKRVKGTIEGDVCEIKDDEIVSYNFRGKIDKGVKVTTTFRMNKQDSAWYLAGNWNTNQTKRFYAVTGKVDLQDEPDIAKSKIIPHLEELGLAKDIPFYAEAKKAEADEERRRVAANTQKQVNTRPATVTTTKSGAEKTQPAINRPVEQVKKQEETIAKVETGKPAATTATIKPVDNTNKLPETTTIAKTQSGNTQTTTTRVQETVNKQDEALVAKSNPEQKKPVTTTVTKQQESIKQDAPVSNTIQSPATETNLREIKNKPEETLVAKSNPEQKKTASTTVTKQQEPDKQNTPPVVVENKKQEAAAVATLQKEYRKTEIPIIEYKAPTPYSAAAAVNQRKMAAPQEVLFRSDSLQVALYDNGEIDGDTVSVLLNNEIMLAKQGLKASAIRKTIYIQPGDNEFTMVLYAENLGKYPPNTGLLVVYDGDERYQVRFSADLQQNATIIFRRKQ